MDKLKRFIDLKINTETCNLRCDYCYVTQNRKFNSKLFKLNFTEQEIKEAFSKKKLGGTCLINLCAGGETLLSNDLMKVIKILLENGHYLMIVTNGTLKNRFIEFSKYNKELKDRLFIKFSFHYLQLKKNNMLDLFFENVTLMKDNNISYTLELGAYDNYIEHIEEIKKISLEKTGSIPHITPLRDEQKDDFSLMTKLDKEKYLNTWKQFNSELFNFRMKIFGKKITDFCYAGDWSICINLDNGDITKCFCENKIGNIFKDKKIKFNAVGKHCKAPYCYAGHAFLAIGSVPTINFGHFDSLRNRDEANYLQNNFKNFMHQKLKDNNKEYPKIKKIFEEIKWNIKKQSNKKISDTTLFNLSYTNSPNITIMEAKRIINNNGNKIDDNTKWIYNWNNKKNKIMKEKIEIEFLNQKRKKSQGTEIWLIGLIIDNIYYSIEDIKHTNWITKNNMIGYRSYDVDDKIKNKLTLYIPKYNDLKIVFESNLWRGKAKITINNKDFYIDTFSKNTTGAKTFKYKK